jgi:CCR4-NOT transcription complex subunit 1
MAKSVFTEPRPSLISYAAGLIRESLTGNPPILSQVYFQFTLEVMRQLAQMGKATEE